MQKIPCSVPLCLLDSNFPSIFLIQMGQLSNVVVSWTDTTWFIKFAIYHLACLSTLDINHQNLSCISCNFKASLLHEQVVCALKWSIYLLVSVYLMEYYSQSKGLSSSSTSLICFDRLILIAKLFMYLPNTLDLNHQNLYHIYCNF